MTTVLVHKLIITISNYVSHQIMEKSYVEKKMQRKSLLIKQYLKNVVTTYHIPTL